VISYVHRCVVACQLVIEWCNRYLSPRPWIKAVIWNGTIWRKPGERKIEWVSELEPSESFPVEGEWPIIVSPFVSLKRGPHFETRKSQERTKIWSWVPRGPKLRTAVLAMTGTNLLDWTGLDWTGTLLSIKNSLFYEKPHRRTSIFYYFFSVNRNISTISLT
jgi:hypothetical protein